MNLKRVACALFALVLMIQFASAIFTLDVNASSVKKVYNIGDTLSGNIAITFDNESLDSVVSTNLGSNTITLGEWIKASGKREGIDYNCSSQGCMPSYRASSSISNINLVTRVPKIFGFKTSGSNVSVRDISFTLGSDFQNSCTLPFLVDALNLGKYNFASYKYTGNLCSRPQQGCFDSTLNAYQTVNLTDTLYCEKIRFSHAPAYILGANISKPGTANDELISMHLYNGDFGTYYGNCTFSGLQSNTSCVLPYPITNNQDYNVCIRTNRTNSPYLIKTELAGSVCGTANMGQSNTRDFDIFASPLEYSSASVIFNSDAFAMFNNEKDFADAINEYLDSEYSSSCLKEDCFIPFKILGERQSINIGNVSITYESDGVPITDSNVYEIEKNASTIKSGRMVLSLENSKLNVSQKSDIFQISIGNRTIIRTNVSVSSLPLTIQPTFALIGIPTTFSAVSTEKLTSASWKFSNSPATRFGINVSQTFPQSGTYTAEVTAITDSGKTYTRSQQILVGEPRASAEELYQLSQRSLSLLSADIKNAPAWILPGITKNFNIVALNNSLQTIKGKLDVAANDTEFVQVIEQLKALNMPSDISIIRTGTLPIITTYGNLNVDYVNSIYQTQVEPEQTKAALVQWTNDNYDSQIETNTYAASTLSGTVEPLLTKVKITFIPKNQIKTEPYLIIDYPIEAIHFLQGYSPKEIQGGTYIPLGNTEVIEFYIEGDVAPSNIGVYILPSLKDLESSSGTYEIVAPNAGKKRNAIYISLGVLILVLIGAVIGLQYWYRHNYEKYLFSDEESLFNIMTFIYNSKKKNLKEGDIRKSLLTSGWTREQISYASGRFGGKILGIFGIPIYSSREEGKVRSRIESRERQNTGRKVY